MPNAAAGSSMRRCRGRRRRRCRSRASGSGSPRRWSSGRRVWRASGAASPRRRSRRWPDRSRSAPPRSLGDLPHLPLVAAERQASCEPSRGRRRDRALDGGDGDHRSARRAARLGRRREADSRARPAAPRTSVPRWIVFFQVRVALDAVNGSAGRAAAPTRRRSSRTARCAAPARAPVTRPAIGGQLFRSAFRRRRELGERDRRCDGGRPSL